MGFGFSEREWRQIQEAKRAADMVSQVVSFQDVIESLERYRGLEQSTLGEDLRNLQEAKGLRESLLAQQLDFQTAAQVALAQQELIRNAIGEKLQRRQWTLPSSISQRLSTRAVSAR